MAIGKSKKDLEKSTNDEIIARIAVLGNKTGKSGNQLGIDAGLGNGTVDGWTDKHLDISKPLVEKFLRHHSINPEWWESGKGEIFIKKHTPAIKSTGNTEMDKEDLYRDLVEGSSDYSLVPKTVLNGEYRMMLISELEDRRASWKEALDSKNQLIAQLKEEIKELRAVKRPAQHAKQ
jgi:hypothetical protein